MIISNEILEKIKGLSLLQKKELEEVDVPEASASIPKNYDQISKAFDDVCKKIGISFHEGIVYRQYLKSEKVKK